MGAPHSVPAIYDSFVHLPNPELKDIQVAAYFWDCFAQYSKLEYILVGSFPARLQSGMSFPVYHLEILLRRGVLANRQKRLRDIRKDWPGTQMLQVTETERDVIIIRENIGITLIFIEAGADYYPDNFNPPPTPRSQYNPGQQTLTPTYRYQNLGYRDIQVPVLRLELLLQQRLSRLQANWANKEMWFQNQRDNDDIQALLRCTARGDELPQFSADVARSLASKVRDWIKFTKEYFGVITQEQWNELSRLRLITAESVGQAPGQNHVQPGVWSQVVQVSGVAGRAQAMQPYILM